MQISGQPIGAEERSGSQEEHSRSEQAQLIPSTHVLPFVLVTLLFFLWGMSNNLTDILVQQFKKSFELSWVEAQLVQTATFLGYFCMAIPAALLMRRWGYKAGILAGLILFGTGTFLFWPAAVAGKYGPFLVALFMVGCGSSVLETAANPFIAQFGSPATSARRLNFSQAFNPPGTMLGVLIGTLFIFSGVELTAPKVEAMKQAGTYAAYLHGEIMRVVPTYVGLSAVVFLLAALIWRTTFPVIASESEGHAGGRNAGDGGFAALLQYPQLILAIIAQFFYVGAQVATWSNLIPYMKQYTAATERQAGYFLLGTLIALAVGRIIATWLMGFIAPGMLMGIFSIINIFLLAAAIVHPGFAGAGMIVLTSFFMSIMFPTIFALGVKGLGQNTKLGGSLIVMSVVGGAVFPPIVGVIARATGSLALGYLMPAAGYVVVAAYGFAGSRLHRSAAVPQLHS